MTTLQMAQAAVDFHVRYSGVTMIFASGATLQGVWTPPSADATELAMQGEANTALPNIPSFTAVDPTGLLVEGARVTVLGVGYVITDAHHAYVSTGIALTEARLLQVDVV